MNLKSLADFINLEEAAGVVETIKGEDQLPSPQRLALEVFRRQYPMLKKGKDPDSPVAIMGIG
jgi:hypothetical protein